MGLRLALLPMVALALLAAASSQGISDGRSVAMVWLDAALESIRVTKPAPPVCARALAVFSTCMYDAWAAYDGTAMGTQFGAGLRRPASERASRRARTVAVSFAAYRALVDLFPTQKPALDAIMASLGLDPTVYTFSVAKGGAAAVGNKAAAAVLAFRHGDGSNQVGNLTASGTPYADYTGYHALNPPLVVTTPSALSLFVNPGHWQPLTYVNGSGVTVTPKCVGPHWCSVQPFAMTSASQFRPPPPSAWDSPSFLRDMEDIVAISAGLTDRQKVIAEYWADGPHTELPPGHWNLFAQWVSQRDGNSLRDDVWMLFAMNNALLDAAIATWEAKLTYDFWRPVSAIRYWKNGQTIRGWGGPGAGTVDMPGETWRPYQPSWFPTPPFQEYTSGHSAFSAAAAEVLSLFTGSDRFGMKVTIPAASLHAEPSLPSSPTTLRWRTFTDAADEAGMSRRYGGIHFREGDEVGRDIGRKVGRLAFAKARRFWEGRISRSRLRRTV